MHKTITLLMAALFAFACGYAAGAVKKHQEPSFEDMIVTNPRDLVRLITPRDKRVRELAARFRTPEEAFLFVRDHVANDPSMPAEPAGDLLAARRASCLGKAVILCSLYRAMGIPSASVRVVTGEVSGYGNEVIDHAWIDMEHDGLDIQQDATNLLGSFHFGQFRNDDYTRAFIRREAIVFNDRHFAVVSPMNMLKDSGHPAIQ